MGKDVAQLVRVVPFTGEANDAFLEQVELQGAHLGDQHVNAHVPLGASDEQRIVNVLLDNALLIVLQVL